MDKLIINAAVTGMVPTKADTPHVPITPDEIVADVRRCHAAGASIVHLHAREPDGRPTYRAEVYREIIDRVRQELPELVISGSTSGRVFGEYWQRSDVLSCRPDLGSLTLGSMNFPKQPSVNSPEMIQMLALAMREQGIVPELELFDLGMADYAHYLVSKGVLAPPYYANILLGSLGTLSATAYNLAMFVKALPPGTVWSGAGIGRFQFFVNSLAIVMGGHVRVGLEDNLYYDAGKKHLATNAGLIDRLVMLAHAAGREIATPAEARAIIGLPQTRDAVARDSVACAA
jgi:uncharacterized protein (DUF849 family)